MSNEIGELLKWLLSASIAVGGFYFGARSHRRAQDSETKTGARENAMVLSEIGYIKANTDEIKTEQREQRKTNTEFVTRLTAVEASAQQAHKRIDKMEKSK